MMAATKKERIEAMHAARRWTLEQGRELIAILEPGASRAGYYLGIIGSVITRGESSKDLDLVAYPGTTSRQDRDAFRDELKKIGAQRMADVDWVRAQWAKKGSTDQKHVEWWAWRGKRIDLFFLA